MKWNGTGSDLTGTACSIICSDSKNEYREGVLVTIAIVSGHRANALAYPDGCHHLSVNNTSSLWSVDSENE